eukprot:Gb_09893 [translate_table: standard]
MEAPTLNTGPSIYIFKLKLCTLFVSSLPSHEEVQSAIFQILMFLS